MSAISTFEVTYEPVVPSRPRLHLVPDPVPATQAAHADQARFARRRFAALAALLIVACGALAAGRAWAGGSTPGEITTTVREGETLSQIAAREMPAAPVDQAVVVIQHANNLGSLHVSAGQQLTIPRD